MFHMTTSHHGERDLTEPTKELPPFSKWLKAVLEKRGLSQRKLAAMSNLSREYINLVVSGQRGDKPQVKTIEALAKALDIPPNEIFDAISGKVTKDRPLTELLSDLRGRMYEMESVTKQLQGVEFVPVIGSIPAGYPDLVEEESASDYVPVPKDVLNNAGSSVYALRITGDSLKGDGIENGDVIIVDRSGEVVEGKIYAIRMENNEVTAKHLHLNQGKVVLRASNGDYDDLVMAGADILGRVIASIKKF